MANKKSVSRNVQTGRFVDTKAAQCKPKTTEHQMERFVKGFYEKNGKAMTQLAYE